MNKHLVVLGIAVLLICIGLSGCIDENTNPSSSEESRFVGTWELIEYDTYDITVTMVFFSDSTMTMTAEGMDYSGTYEIKDGKLVFNSKTSGMESYDYSFSSDGMELTLRKIGSDINMVYTRQ